MIRFGWATRDFTPNRPTLLFGQMHVRVAHKARDPLMLTALAMDDDTSAGRAIWIACDLCCISEALVQGVRERLASRLPDVPADAVILSATHTHDGPTYEEGMYPHPGGDVMTFQETRDSIADHAAAAAVAAWESRVPRMVSRAFGHAVIGHNRRAVYTDGSSLMYGKTDRPDFLSIEGYEDHSLDLLAIREPDGTLSGLVLNIPCPSQVEENLTELSADYWQEIRLELRRRLGQQLHILPLCGAAGDQSPHFLLYERQEQEMRQRRGLTERQEIAQRVGEAVSHALACTLPVSGPAKIVHAVRRLSLPGRQVTRQERDVAQAWHDQAIVEGSDPNLWWPQRLGKVVECFDQGRPMPSTPIEMHVLRIGEAVLATNPFELYLDYGLRIKARSPAAQTFIAQLTAGCGWYLPTERAIHGGHYGAHPVVAPVGPEGGQLLVEETLSTIRQVFKS